jgi:dipeptidyl aminopeptidase/acylaminoacyl peptidase
MTAGKDKKQFDSLEVEFLGFSADGGTVAGSRLDKVTLWDRQTGKEIRDLKRPAGSYPRFAFFPDGKSILISDRSGGRHALAVVDAKTGADLRKFPNIRTLSNALAVAPSGRSAVSVSATTISLYEMLTLEERASVNLETWSFALAFSPSGRVFVSGGRDAVVRLWDAANGRAIRQMTGHGGAIDSLAFSPDGRWLVSTAENIALVWDVEAILRESKFIPMRLAEAEMDGLWRDLAVANTGKSAAAVSRLSLGGKDAAAYLVKELTKPSVLKTDNIDKWVADLGSDRFAIRENATRELQKVGNLAAPALRAALEKAPSVEAKRRMELLLAELSAPPSAWLQANRALETLELIGDRIARSALETLAKESPDRWLRLEAGQALQRLERSALP